MTSAHGRTALARIPWRWVQRGTIAIAVVGLVLRLFEIASDSWGTVGLSAAHQFIPVLVVLVVSVGLRLRSTVQVLAAALGGFFTSTWIAYHVGGWITDLMGSSSPLRTTVAVPLVEEAVKAIPLLVIAWTWHRKPVRPGIVDLGLAGMAAGAGFAFHEDLMWGRVASSGTTEAIGWVLPSVHTESGLVAGHLVWTGLIGLAIGVAVSGRWRASWIALVLSAVLAVVDHGTWNDEAARESLGWAVGGGWLPIAVFLVGVLVAFVSDTRAVRSVPAARRVLPLDVLRYVRNGQSKTPLGRWHQGSQLMHITTGAAHGLAARQGAPEIPEPAKVQT